MTSPQPSPDPVPIIPDYRYTPTARVPKDLLALPNWVVWKYEIDKGKLKKVPYNPATGRLARSNDPETWSTFTRAESAYRAAGTKYSGIGFMFSDGCGFVGIDLDDCFLPDGELKPWAQAIYDQFADSYGEYSPSRTGIKLWVRGKLPSTGKNHKWADGGIEVYDQGRYFTFTGWSGDGPLLEIVEHQVEIDELYAHVCSLIDAAPDGREPRTEPNAVVERTAVLGGVSQHVNGHGASSPSTTMPAFDIERFLAKFVKGLGAPKAYRGGSKWPIVCPFCGRKTTACVFECPSGAVGFTCLNSACAGLRWKEFREHVAGPRECTQGTPEPVMAAPDDWVLEDDAIALEGGPPPTARELLQNLPPEFMANETGNADRLFQRYGDDLAHCEERNGYMVWNGDVWRYDRFVLSEKMAEQTMLDAFSEAAEIADAKERAIFLKFLDVSLKRTGLENMAHLTKKKVRQVKMADFDRDPFLLNCRNGTINLRTGELQPHRKDDLQAKMIPFDYIPTAECPQFLRFLFRIMGDGPDATESERDTAHELVAYLQRLFGAAATGNPEKLLIVLYGRGNNGKTTLLNIVSRALGDHEYASQINIESLMVDPKGGGMSNAVNSDLSDLQGCRFVYSSEVERGQRLALSRVKSLTGLGELKARRLKENWITFPPTWKIFLDCNDRPVISSPTDAIWNRVKCVPFTIDLTPDEIDTNLPAKLETELPGILAWIVAGAQDYITHGIGTVPAVVGVSTDEYRDSSDKLKDFIADCCDLNPRAWVASDKLAHAYGDWCTKNGEKYPLGTEDFKAQIRLKGCTPQQKSVMNRQTRGWQGIAVNHA